MTTLLIESLKQDFKAAKSWSDENVSNKEIPAIVHGAISHYLIACDKAIRELTEELGEDYDLLVE